MRYWTAITADNISKACSSIFHVPASVHGTTTEDSVFKTGVNAKVLFMVDAKLDDLKKLGNALVIPVIAASSSYGRSNSGGWRLALDAGKDNYSSRQSFERILCAICPSVLSASTDIGHTRSRPTDDETKNTYYKTYDKSDHDVMLKEGTIVIRNGEIADDLCKDCTNILERAVGGCDAPAYRCSREFFDMGVKLTLPEKSLFIPLSNCTEYADFQRRDVTVMMPDELPGEAEYKGRHPDIARDAVATKRFKSLCCSSCIMCPDSGTCSWATRARLHSWSPCGGPYVESDIPKIDGKILKLATMHRDSVDWPLFKEYANKHGIKIPRWRADPQLVIGGRLNSDVTQIAITQTRGVDGGNPSYSPIDILIPITAALKMRDGHKGSKKWPVPFSPKNLRDRLLLAMYQHSHSFHYHGVCGSRDAVFSGLKLSSERCAVVHYMKQRYEATMYMWDHQNMLNSYRGELAQVFVTGNGTEKINRREAIIKELYDGNVAPVEAFVKRLVSTSIVGEDTRDIKFGDDLPA